MSDLINVAPIKISKLEAARRQLVTAIRLYFANGDVVSTHTLAAAAFEILRDLDAHGPKTGTLFDHMERNIKPEYVETFRKLIRKPGNFFKHANKDPERVLEYYPSNPIAILWAASEKYNELANEELLETMALRSWFILQNPDILLPPYREQVKGLNPGRDYPSARRQEFFDKIATVHARAERARIGAKS